MPEARVEISKVAAVIFPISLFWFAWTTYVSVHWIVPILASALWGWSFYTLILMTYMVTEDSYKVSILSDYIAQPAFAHLVKGLFGVRSCRLRSRKECGWRWLSAVCYSNVHAVG